MCWPKVEARVERDEKGRRILGSKEDGGEGGVQGWNGVGRELVK